MLSNGLPIELNGGSSALRGPQMYKLSERKAAAVRLPNTDQRQPFEKRASDAATDSDQQSTITPSSSSSSSSSSSPEYQKTTVKIPSAKHDQDVKKSYPFPQVPCGRSEYHNEGIGAAKLRYQQEKLGKKQEAKSAYQKSGHSPLSSMESISSTKSARNSTGPQPVVRLSHHSSSSPHRIETNNRNVPSPFVSHHTAYTSRPDHARLYQTSRKSGLNRSSREGWSQWVEVGIKFFDLPPTATTFDVYKGFRHEGNVMAIELYENTRGEREGKGVVRFSPPPTRPFWELERFLIPIADVGNVYARLQLEQRKRTFLHPSPSNPLKKYPESMVGQQVPRVPRKLADLSFQAIKAESLDFGIMFDQTTMMSMRTMLPTSAIGIQFRLNLSRRELIIEFPIHIQDPRTIQGGQKVPHSGRYDRTDLFRYCIPFSQLKEIRQIERTATGMALLISMETPPKFFKKIDPVQSHDDAARVWNDSDAWYRQTDVVYAPYHLKQKPLTLQKTAPIVDLGRWTTYRFVFDMSKNDSRQFQQMREAMHDYNVDVLPLPGFSIAGQHTPAVWKYLDQLEPTKSELDDLVRATMPSLAFEVRYQLEVCISHGYLNEYNLDQAFVSQLVSMSIAQARDLLEYVANLATREFNPMGLFRKTFGDGSLVRSKIPHYCAYIRSATVTPTTVHFHTPVAETSNRVIRQFAAHADRFLRVRFTDEKSEGAIYATDKNTKNEIFTRIKRVLANGIVIGDRKFEFLASGNSQFREHGAYFFAPLPNLSAGKIRDWMGLFSEIKTVPLYASRLGQCFSTTRAIHGAKPTIVEIPDIERNGFNFTDGVGRISHFFACLAASELGIMNHSPDPPSVFQVRVEGCKGILALSPSSGATEIHIRESQYKFPAKHEGLEIIRWSQYMSANLNRQLILILSALGIPDSVFVQKLRLQLSTLERAMTDETTALSILQKDIDHNQMTLVLASMILDGFQRAGEPFVISLLQLWRAWSIKYLKEKARISVNGGALLFGCVDETATLQGHYDATPRPLANASVKEKANYVPQVFVQVSKGSDGKSEVILGPMLLARNPSLHPGDLRVVCGVDIPELHHLRDVVVLPQTGDRDVAGMCSGGDLDGDDFLVIWDEELLPLEWNLDPMDYSRPLTPKHGKKIDVDDLTTFFVTYMKNDTLSNIANAHLANADYLEAGVKDEKCLKLAALHSMAVDYVKTGLPAQMTRDLRAPKRPHFMNSGYEKADQFYTSRKVLGQLYDQVERIDFVPSFTSSFDSRILGAYELSTNMLAGALEVKKEYDAHMRRIMAQYDVKTEFEVWSSFVLQHAKGYNAFKFHERIGQLSGALKDQFRDTCRTRAGGKVFEQLGPFVAAMYKVTAAEMAQAVRECQQTQNVGGRRTPLREMTPAKMPLMSFPWLFPDILGKIAVGKTRTEQTTMPHKAINPKASMARKFAEAARDTGNIFPFRKRHLGQSLLDTDDDLQTKEGETHRGELLELFEDPDHLVDQHQYGGSGASPSRKGTSRPSIPSAEAMVTSSVSVKGPFFRSSSSQSPQLVDVGPSETYRQSQDAFTDALVPGSLAPVEGSATGSRSLSSGWSTNEINLLELEDQNSSDGNLANNYGGGGVRNLAHSEGIPTGPNLQLLQDLMSDTESDVEDAGVPLSGHTHGSVRLPYGNETISFDLHEDDSRNKATEAKHHNEEEGKEKTEGVDEVSDESDAESEEVVIHINGKPVLYDHLENMGMDEPADPALNSAEAKAIDGPTSKPSEILHN